MKTHKHPKQDEDYKTAYQAMTLEELIKEVTYEIGQITVNDEVEKRNFLYKCVEDFEKKHGHKIGCK